MEHIITTISHFIPSLRDEASRRRRGILVCTADSMQGSQRHVVIFSTTRSNPYGNVGFVENPRRLNVSVTRPRYLTVIIGDSSTIKFTGKGIPQLLDVYEKCTSNEHGDRVYKPVIVNGNPSINYEFALQEPLRTVTTRSSSSNNEYEEKDNTLEFDFAGQNILNNSHNNNEQ